MEKNSKKLIGKRINLFLIHDSLEDNTWRKCIRVCTDKTLLSLLKHLINECDFNKYQRNLPFSIHSISVISWFKGRIPIPLIAIYSLLQTIKEKEGNECYYEYFKKILTHLNWFKSTTISKETFLPSKISDDLLYSIGIIIGDGSLPLKFTNKGNRLYPVYICGTNKKFMQNTIFSIMKKVFKVEFLPRQRIRKDRKPLYEWCVSSKPLQRYLNKLFDIPLGKKSQKVRIPEIVRSLPPLERIPLIVGLMDTDWGIESWNFGTGTKSKQLLEDTLKTLNQINKNIKFKTTKRIINNKFWTFSGYVLKNSVKELYNLITKRYKFKNKEKIKAIKKNVSNAPIV